MLNDSPHTFHIPVMGIGFTIDTPLKVAKFGINSVVSIVDDELIETMRAVVSKKYEIDYSPIATNDINYRALRIKSYLNLLNTIVNQQITDLKSGDLQTDPDLIKYYNLLPENSLLKKKYSEWLEIKNHDTRVLIEKELKSEIKAGSIDVNIMTKLDKDKLTKEGELLPKEYSDAMSALRGFCESDLSSSIIFSAGMNPRLFTYCESFQDFFPDKNGFQKKKIVLKVSDFRSAMIQSKIFAKKGIWVSEFRIESGLNCGGHAFATQGVLLGPILEEFKVKKDELVEELLVLSNTVLKSKNLQLYSPLSTIKVTTQGGIGNNQEDDFLLNHYRLDGTGWGSPFLLVPESTNVDEKTIKTLMQAKKEDYYLSEASPLGVRFNNVKLTSSDNQRISRIEKNRPGSPCHKEYLQNNTEFTEKPICTASRLYQKLKIEEIDLSERIKEIKDKLKQKVMAKECLCQGLGSSARLNNKAPLSHKLSAVSICPGPNLSFFGENYKLTEMVSHIYGRLNLNFTHNRPHMFINEARLYLDYLKNETDSQIEDLTNKKKKYFDGFKANLELGLNYYIEKHQEIYDNSVNHIDTFIEDINSLKRQLELIRVS